MVDGIETERLYTRANLLALATICYNLLEGFVSIWFGARDETLSLFGFGLDSFVEVISAVGIWHMVRRIRLRGVEERDRFERNALRITGTAFYLLAAGLLLSAVLSLVQSHQPESTTWGIIVSLLSITFMWLLIRLKVATGRALDSPAILADAACSKACLYLSLVLLVSSGGWYLTSVPFFDAGGAILIAFFSYREGKEAFGTARGTSCCCSGACEKG